MLLRLFYGVARRKVVPRRRLPRFKPFRAARNFSQACGIAWFADTGMSELATPVSLRSEPVRGRAAISIEQHQRATIFLDAARTIDAAQLKAFGSHSRGGKSLEQVPDRGVDFPDLRVTTGSELRGNRTGAAQN
jgi:hypothetical protein